MVFASITAERKYSKRTVKADLQAFNSMRYTQHILITSKVCSRKSILHVETSVINEKSAQGDAKTSDGQTTSTKQPLHFTSKFRKLALKTVRCCF